MSIKHTILVSFMMLSAMMFLNFFNRAEDRQLKRPLSEFPTHLGEWRGTVLRFDQAVYNILGVDDSLLSSYRNNSGRVVQLYVGYYRSQREGRIIHSPRNCMPGAGWNIVESSLEEFDIPGGHLPRMRATKLILEKGSDKQVAFYWFQSRGRIVASEFRDRLYLLYDAFRLHRTDESFVRLLSPVHGGDQDFANRQLRDFTQQLVPALQSFLPS